MARRLLALTLSLSSLLALDASSTLQNRPLLSTSDFSQHCNYTNARFARQALSALLHDHVSAEHLSPQCKLLLDNDPFEVYANNRFDESRHKSTCGFCGKSFENALFLDAHFARRHADALTSHLTHLASQPAHRQFKCLSDHCDVLQCPLYGDSLTRRSYLQAPCDEADMAEHAAKCKLLVDECLIPGDPLVGKVANKICGRLTCKYRHHVYQNLDAVAPATLLRSAVGFVVLGFSLLFYLTVILEWLEDGYSDSWTRRVATFVRAELMSGSIEGTLTDNTRTEKLTA